MCFFVDPFNGPNASSRSLAGLRAAQSWLTTGGVLIIFPAGAVAHTRRANDRTTYVDRPWTSVVGRMALATGAEVVPALIHGANSQVFYAAGRVHSSLRTAYSRASA
jgi:putative hemolysin